MLYYHQLRLKSPFFLQKIPFFKVLIVIELQHSLKDLDYKSYNLKLERQIWSKLSKSVVKFHRITECKPKSGNYWCRNRVIYLVVESKFQKFLLSWLLKLTTPPGWLTFCWGTLKHPVVFKIDSEKLFRVDQFIL